MRDDCSFRFGDRAVAVFGPVSSCFTLAWLATHRDRLRTILLGGKRLSVLIVWDRKGCEKVPHPDGEIEAIHQIVYGYPATASDAKDQS